MTLDEIRAQLHQDLEELGIIEKYDVIVSTDETEEGTEDDCNELKMNMATILVMPEPSDSLKDIEDNIIEFIKQQYSNKDIFSIMAFEHEDED